MTLAAEDNNQDSEQSESTGPISVNGVKGDELRSIIKRIETVEERKAGMSADIKMIKDEAKSNGFDVKTLNTILKLRKMDATTIEAEELLLEIYKRALGMTD